MDLVFYGLCLVLLKFDFNGLDVLPDFVGYFLMYRGLGQLASEGKQFPSLQSWCLGMALVTLPLPFVTLLGEASLVIGGALAIMRLYILYRTVQSVEHLQQRYADAFFDVETLRVRRALVITGAVVVYAAAWLGMNGLISGIIALADMIICILFLMAFHRARLAYRAVKS